MKNTYQVVKPAIEKIQHSIKSFEKLNFNLFCPQIELTIQCNSNSSISNIKQQQWCDPLQESSSRKILTVTSHQFGSYDFSDEGAYIVRQQNSYEISSLLGCLSTETCPLHIFSFCLQPFFSEY